MCNSNTTSFSIQKSIFSTAANFYLSVQSEKFTIDNEEMRWENAGNDMDLSK